MTPQDREETRNPELETRNQKPGTRNPEPETRNPKPGTRNPELLFLSFFSGKNLHHLYFIKKFTNERFSAK